MDFLDHALDALLGWPVPAALSNQNDFQSPHLITSSASARSFRGRTRRMAVKITNEVLEGYFACKFKAHLKLSGQHGTISEYECMLNEARTNATDVCAREIVFEYETAQVVKSIFVNSSELREGPPLILNAMFEDEHFLIHFDGLKKVPGPSAIGDFHYLPILFRDRKEVHKPQRQLLHFLASLLSRLQGRPPALGIIHGGGSYITNLRLQADEAGTQSLVQELVQMQRGRLAPLLMLNDHCQVCEFRDRCDDQARKEDNLSLLRGISETEINRLRAKGIFTTNQLSYTFRTRRIAKRVKVPSNPHHFALQALAIRENKVFVHGNPVLKFQGTRLFLDIEGTTQSYYLIGLLTVVDGDETYKAFWADSDESQVRIFCEFLDYLKRYHTYSVIHYGAYEIRALRQMRDQLSPEYQTRIDETIKCSVNVLSVIGPHIYFPTYSNGLKDIGKYLKCSWNDRLSSGLLSLVWRRRWLLGEASYEEKLLRYNREDCSALRRVAEFIEAITSARGSAPSQSDDNRFVHTGTLSKDKDQTALFGRKDFALDEFARINECAYFDYQRDRVFAASRNAYRRKVKGRKSNRDMSKQTYFGYGIELSEVRCAGDNDAKPYEAQNYRFKDFVNRC
jgi:predicted RecB family nuclease